MNTQFRARWGVAGALLLASVLAPAYAAFDTVYVDDDQRVEGGFGFGPDGSAYLIATDEGGASHIKRISPAGNVLWDDTFDGHTVWSSRIEANDDRACAAVLQGDDAGAENLTAHAICVDADTGALIWRRQIAEGLTANDLYVHLGTNVTVLYTVPGGTFGQLRHARLNGSGTLLTDVAVQDATHVPEFAGFADDGTALVANALDTGTDYVRINVNGVQVARFNANTFGLNYGLFTQADDGSVLLVGPQAIPTVATRTVALKLDGNGVEVWRTTLRNEEFVPFPAVIDNGVAYFGISHEASPGDGFANSEPPHFYLALDYDNGGIIWDVAVPANRQAYFTGSVSDDGGTLVLVHTLLNSKIRVQTREVTTGAILLDTEIECGFNSCSNMISTVGDDDVLRIIARASSVNAHAVYTLDNAAGEQPQSRVDQRGISGAWSVGTNGQGLVFDFDPASGTLFAPWFTMANVPIPQSGTTTIADLRWYTLQATLPQDTRSATVVIYETTDGTFASGAPITPLRVGQGTLVFNSCSEGSFAYSFDDGHNGGAQGVLGLSRLTPRTTACTELQGNDEVELPPEAPASANGFSRSYSGSWSQVGSSGQGLEFVVVPNGFVAGAWFTFDPAGQANDDGQQHWFTFDGSLAGATNGTVEVTLYQTIGGSFDFRPSRSITAVGTATITFDDCETATLDYTFGANAAHFANLTGTVELEHLGVCEGDIQ